MPEEVSNKVLLSTLISSPQQDHVITARTLAEYNTAKPGTAYFDTSTDHSSTLYSIPGSVYYIAELEGQVIGGAGIFPTPALPEDTCELVKIYLLPQSRGLGLGRALIDHCLAFARMNGYKKIYLETLNVLKDAVHLYKKMGFKMLEQPLGNSGHYGCDIWMLLII